MERKRFLRIITGGVLVSVLGLPLPAARAESGLSDPVELTPEEKPFYDNPPTAEQIEQIRAMITSHCIDAGVSSHRFLNLAYCESRFNPWAVNRLSGAAGLFQFVPTTWRRVLRNILGREDLDIFDAEDNTIAAVALWKKEGPGHWVCR